MAFFKKNALEYSTLLLQPITCKVGARFSYLENAIFGLLEAETVRNICFHVEYCLGDLSAMAQGNPSVAV